MAALDDEVDRLLERGRGGQADDVDARDHHLVDAALAELDAAGVVQPEARAALEDVIRRVIAA